MRTVIYAIGTAREVAIVISCIHCEATANSIDEVVLRNIHVIKRNNPRLLFVFPIDLVNNRTIDCKI